MRTVAMRGTTLVAGEAQGRVLWSDVPLSFWGGVDPDTGEVIDRHHPLHGCHVGGTVLVLPGARGSCTGSSVMLQLLLNGHGPAALVVVGGDDILLLGVLVASRMFGRSMPVVAVDAATHQALARVTAAQVGTADGRGDSAADGVGEDPVVVARIACAPSSHAPLELSPLDRARLAGHEGRARQVAMEIIVHMAQLNGARCLLNVRQAHIDGCIYTGEASLRFAQQLVAWGGRVAVPTSLNAISVDRCGWRQQGVPPAFGKAADALAQAYVDMGAAPTFTCAPYFLQSAPRRGEHIAWGESNAVVFANSVIGARTAKYPDFLDALIALTGRAAAADCQMDAPRRATVRIDVDLPAGHDESLYPLLGYAAGLLAPADIPVITGLEGLRPTADELRAFGAAFGTSSGAPMFHMVGVTPEADTLAGALGDTPATRTHRLGRAELQAAWRSLNTATAPRSELVALGNPHLSAREIARLAELCRTRRKDDSVAMIVTTARATLAEPSLAQPVATLRRFGARFIVDTCWCMINEPIVPVHARTIMTNSGKYAHYAPGLLGREACFGSLRDCVETACTGLTPAHPPGWLA